MRRGVIVALALAACFLLGCAPKRFAGLSRGEYECDAVVSANTCGSPVTGGSMLETIDGAGGSLISLSVPGQSTVSPMSDAWDTVQFGAQEDPMAYAINGPAHCIEVPTHAYDWHEHARITHLAANEIDIEVTYDYTTIHSCGITGVGVESCSLTYDVTCTHTP